MKRNTTPALSSSNKRLARRGLLRLLGLALGAMACNLPGVRPQPTAETTPEAGETPPPPAATSTPVATNAPTTVPDAASPPTPAPAPPALFVIDGHEDIAWNWLEFGRDPRESALTIQQRERGGNIEGFVGRRSTGLPEWLAGRVGLIFATVFVMPARHAWSASMTQVYADPQEAHEKGLEQAAAYDQLAASEPSVCLVASRDTLEQVASAWMDANTASPCVGLVMTMEGADPIREPAEVAEWHARGLRIIGPAWAKTQYAGGTGEPGPLTDLGRALLDEMSRLNMILDLSHIAEESFFEAVERYPGAIIASHSNPRVFLPTDRGLSDEMIRAIASRGGVIGITPYNRYLQPGWDVGDRRVAAETFVEAIQYVVQVTGSAEHVAIGSDFDGGFGVEAIPDGFNTVADLLTAADLLSGAGYADDQIAAVLYGNWLRILRTALS